MNQVASFEKAVATMQNLRAAAKAGDAEAVRLLEMAEAGSPGFILADLRKYEPKGEK